MFKPTMSPPSIVVIDNFYQNVDEVRQQALSAHKYPNQMWKGKRSDTLPTEETGKLRSLFSRALGISLDEFNIRSHFHLHDADTPVVYHTDHQRWAAVIYLTPNPPVKDGTSIWQSRLEKRAKNVHFGPNSVLDGSYWEEQDRVGNVYNRCILFDAHCVHSVSGYFGETDENRRLVQLFFFDPK